MITMAEIARLTGVSQPTVSRVLNGNKAVNPEIRERVLACAREHEFQPNVMAQSLVGSKTHLIGVVVTDIGNAFFADLVKHIEQAAGQAGYSMILFNSGYDRDHEKECGKNQGDEKCRSGGKRIFAFPGGFMQAGKPEQEPDCEQRKQQNRR